MGASRTESIGASRCFLLFWALLALLTGTSFVGSSVPGRWLVGALNVLILVTAVAALQRSRRNIIVALCLGLPALGFQIAAIQSDTGGYFATSWTFNAAFYAFTIGNLLHYVLRQGDMTSDKLYGAVAAYIMIGIMGAFVHGVLQYFEPSAYHYQGGAKTLNLSDFIFFSFTVLTTAGFGDITPVIARSRYLTIIEAVTGVMYVAILIARLTGVYPVRVSKP